MGETMFSPDTLATLGGASFLTYLVVAYTKAYVQRFWKVTTDLYAVLIGFVVVLLAQFAVGANPADWVVYFLSAANGFLVAAAAGKMNDKAVVEHEKQFATDATRDSAR